MDELLPKDITIIEEKGKFVENDPGFLVAKGRFFGSTKRDKAKARNEHINRLTRAASASLLKNDYASIRSIGPNAKSNASEACANIREEFLKQDINIYFIIEREIGNLGPLRSGKHVQDVEAIVYKMYKIKKEKTEK